MTKAQLTSTDTQICCTSKEQFHEVLKALAKIDVRWQSGDQADFGKAIKEYWETGDSVRYLNIYEGRMTYGTEKYSGYSQISAAQLLAANSNPVTVTGPKHLMWAFFNTLKELGLKERTSQNWNEKYNPDSDCLYLHSGSGKGGDVELQWHSHDCDSTVYMLPEQWNEAQQAMVNFFEANTNKYTGPWKVGDTITEDELNCPGIKRFWGKDKWDYEGDSFIGGRTIVDILFYEGRWAAEVGGTSKGLYVDLDSIQIGYTSLKIADYVADFSKPGSVKFGCQSFSKADVEVIHRLITSNSILAKVSIHGTEITQDMIEKIYRGMK